MTDAPEPKRPQPPSAAPPVRRMDARSLRGLAHPLRMRILDLLALDGPDTATGLGRRLDENTGTVSWHLRHLADHGFIEEETGRGTRRERWWRAVRVARRLDTNDFRDDPDSQGALSVYLRETVHRDFGQVTTYLAEEWAAEWRDAGTLSRWQDLRLTPDQLAALNAELEAVVVRHREAAAREAAAGDGAEPGAEEARPVIVQLQSFPRKERDGR
ncbi:helix-turn-helix domain-containing protein [Streptomyces sp. P9-2B-2]|uniref:winged helix-turn-helix domain-containing protein n=1 Tax=Streptomyces sp. P9-2B-2 TaxID=3057114 RepID=UPI0025B4987C|nr:helix-turn-helix domain-containing protein [Streptomyces sp. P9-2B-2]WJY37362.1 helix-turn-helix domain-containing protein [Streptomyces sp. P9-2B-2]